MGHGGRKWGETVLCPREKTEQRMSLHTVFPIGKGLANRKGGTEGSQKPTVAGKGASNRRKGGDLVKESDKDQGGTI